MSVQVLATLNDARIRVSVSVSVRMRLIDGPVVTGTLQMSMSKSSRIDSIVQRTPRSLLSLRVRVSSIVYIAV